MPFWKKRQPAPTGVIWQTEMARDKGVCGDVQAALGSGDLVLLVTHFPVTHRHFADLFGKLGIPSRTLETPGDFAPGNLRTLRAERTVALIPFPLLAMAPDQKLEGRGGDPALLVVPEVHPLPTPGGLITRFAQSLDFACKTQFHVTLSSEIFARLGESDRMEAMIEKFDLEEDDRLEHKWLWRSIQKGQEKIARQSTGDQPAESEAEWFKLNC